MSKNQKYPLLLPSWQDWPIVRLDAAHEAFVKAVTEETVQKLLTVHAGEASLRGMLLKTATVELRRAQQRPWRVDRADEVAFWQRWVAELPEQPVAALPAALQAMVNRYVQEMLGRFRKGYYQAAKWVAPYGLARSLQPVGWWQQVTPRQVARRLAAGVQIVGAVEELRALARVGTVVLVPAHVSMLDSLLMGWVIAQLGLPYFMHGAGLNVFNNRLVGYFLNNLGTYKIDRRRKNLPYLTALKTYASLALSWGCHSIFYPGGTRSRSGALEEELKLGLLGAAFEAQERNYAQEGPEGRKLFVVPVVLNYPYVPEAPQLIRSYLAAKGLPQGQEVLSGQRTRAEALAAGVVVSVGAGMDLLGNRVDATGQSYDAQGRPVDIYHCFMASSAAERSATGAQSKALGQALLAAYRRENCVLPSHLVAFASFGLLRQAHAELTLEEFFQLPVEKLVVPYAALVATCGRLRQGVLALQEAGQVQVTPQLTEHSVEALVTQGMHSLGAYHAQRPLVRTPAGVVPQDLAVLFYYHNRLQGYGLEKYLS